MGGTRFMVQWEEHPSHLATRLGQLLEHQTLVDVTLMCNTHTLRVHRAVLAACSPYFETILQRQLGMHPLIVLKDMQFSVLKSLIEFMYCGETSVTEDNLGALLQAAKFFQVKGLSAMTKEALGLVPTPKPAVNGDAARKAFVGRPKRVGMQQTLVTSGLKPVAAAHASSSHGATMVVGGSGELATLPTKTTFQTISKPVVAARPETQQQQTDTAQLLLSLSGSEFPKQTFHTVSKNVRFQHNVPSSAISVEPARASSLEASIKAKEVVSRIPVMTPNGGVKAAAVSQQSGQIEHATPTQAREDVLVTNPQAVFISDSHRRRGRPIKRQMNVLFQERMMTDADMALHKEAEASRKALEMLRQEMASEPAETTVTAAASASPTPTEVTQKPPLAKPTLQMGGKLQTTLATTSRTVPLTQPAAKRVNTNVVYKQAASTVANAAGKKVAAAAATSPAPTPALALAPAPTPAPAPEPSASSVNVTFKVDEPEPDPEPVYQLAEEAAPAPEAPKEPVAEYQEAGEAAAGAEGETELAAGTNIVYQMADGTTAAPGSVMSQYMEVLKEAGLPTDVPILLDSGDGSYVTVNEEVLMNIVNGGVLQCHVTEGNIVAGEGVEFIVQEFTEDEMEAVQAQAQAQAQAQEAEVGPEPAVEVKPEVKTEGAEELPAAETVNESETAEFCEAPNPPEERMDIDPEIKVKSPDYIVPDEVPKEDELSNNNNVSQDGYDAVVEKENFSEASEKESVIYASTQSNAEEVECEEKEKPQHEAEMSVEQALQAMMGETSDSELESSQREATASKGDDIESELENTDKSLQEEEAKTSEDLQFVLRSEEETQDLRLVLSPEEDVKEERSNEDSNSFAIVLSPGSTGDRETGVVAEGLEGVEAESVAVEVAETEGEPLESQLEPEQEHELLQVAEEPEVVQEPGVAEDGEGTGQPLPLDSLAEVDADTESVAVAVAVAEPEPEPEPEPVAEVEAEAEANIDVDASRAEELAQPMEAVEPVGTEPPADSQEIMQLTGAVPPEHAKTKGKETSADMPARVKRKAPSSDGPDKKMKIIAADADNVVEQSAAELDGATAVIEEVSSAAIAAEDKDRTVLSMPELVTDPTDG